MKGGVLPDVDGAHTFRHFGNPRALCPRMITKAIPKVSFIRMLFHLHGSLWP